MNGTGKNRTIFLSTRFQQFQVNVTHNIQVCSGFIDSYHAVLIELKLITFMIRVFFVFIGHAIADSYSKR